MSAFITNDCMTRREKAAGVNFRTHTTSYHLISGLYYPATVQPKREFEEYKKVVIGYKCYFSDEYKRLIPVHIVNVAHPVWRDETVVFIVEEDDVKRPKQHAATISDLFISGVSWLLDLSRIVTEDLEKKANLCVVNPRGPRLDVSMITVAARRQLNHLLKSVDRYRDLPIREQDL